MATPFIGEIRMFSFNYAPKGWALCNGQLLPINQNQALFSILGTTYGGDGRVNFALPDLRSRTPVYEGQGLVLGERLGEENHTLIQQEMPQHTHLVSAVSSDANQRTPTGMAWAASDLNPYSSAQPDVTLNPQSVPPLGGSQPHPNMSPFLVINFCVALVGVFPSQN